MEFDPQKVLLNVRRAETADLLDRVTAYRAGMEPEALEMIEDELADRGVTPAEIDRHAEACRQECLYHPDGAAAMCSFCRRPAVAEGRGWVRLLGLVPVLPRRYWYCKDHRPAAG